MTLKPPFPRHTVRRLEESVEIVLPTKKQFFRIAWFGLWFLVWAYMTGSVIYILTFIAIAIFGSPQNGADASAEYGILILPAVFVLLILFALLGMGGFGIYQFLWQLVGKEVVNINNQNMSVSRQVFKWNRTAVYSVKDIQDLRVSILVQSFFGVVRSVQRFTGKNGIIAFDYGAKTFRFGIEIDEAEAKQIVGVLQPYLPQQKTG